VCWATVCWPSLNLPFKKGTDSPIPQRGEDQIAKHLSRVTVSESKKPAWTNQAGFPASRMASLNVALDSSHPSGPSGLSSGISPDSRTIGKFGYIQQLVR
jgi:hypothetical protein